jgi:hypothetical protein
VISYEIKFDTDLHKKVLEALNSRSEMADKGYARVEHKWQEADEAYRAYSPDTDKVAEAREKKRAGELEYVQLNVPFSTATLLTAHTYWSSIFLSRNPIFQYMALSAGPEDNVLAVEALMNYQMARGRQLPLWAWLMDVGKYGRGIIGHYWDREIKTIANMYGEPGPPGGRSKQIVERTELVGYEGNRLFNVHPKDFRPDPRVSLAELQRGEYCGRKVRMSWNELLAGESRGRYFNVEELRKQSAHMVGAKPLSDGSPDQVYPDTMLGSELLPEGQGFLDCTEWYVNLIPKQWGLSSEGTTPEKWVFLMWDGKLIIEARPCGYLHNRFPYEVLEYEIDPYSISTRGVLEMLEPLNYLMTWLVNAHFYNVRAILNGTYVVDTARVMASDLRKKGPGRVFRLNPAFSGTDVRTVIAQLQTADVTQGNLQDLQLVEQLAARLIGANPNTMGVVNPGGRKTATEIRGTQANASGRLKTNAEYFSAMGFSPLGGSLLSNCQQYYSSEKKLLIAGEQWRAMEYIDVNPETIAGEYDYVPVDGNLPIDHLAQATLWRELFQVAATVPQIAQGLDIAGIFSWVAQLAGLKNINRFKINVMPPGMEAGGPPVVSGGAPPNVMQMPAPNQREIPLGNVGTNIGPAA